MVVAHVSWWCKNVLPTSHFCVISQFVIYSLELLRQPSLGGLNDLSKWKYTRDFNNTWVFLCIKIRMLPFFLIDCCHCFKTGSVLDLSRNRLRPLNPTFGNIKRDVNDWSYCAREKTNPKFSPKLQGWILKEKKNKNTREGSGSPPIS